MLRDSLLHEQERERGKSEQDVSPQLGKIQSFVALVPNLAKVQSLWVPKRIHIGWCSLTSRFFRVPSALRFQEP